MVVGIGVDLVDIARARRMYDAHGSRALARLLTVAEGAFVLSKADPVQHFAVRLAAKEAAYKALAGSMDARLISWLEIEVTPANGGPPGLVFHGRAQARAAELGVTRAWVTLSHADSTAIAMVVLEGKTPAAG